MGPLRWFRLWREMRELDRQRKATQEVITTLLAGGEKRRREIEREDAQWQKKWQETHPDGQVKKGGPLAEDEGYCVRCKAKRVMANVTQVKLANARSALKGTCPVCGYGMFKVLLD